MTSRVCEVDGCNEQHWCRGYCIKHYARWKETGRPIAQRQYKKAHEKEVIQLDKNTYKIELTKGHWALISAEDIERVKKHSWGIIPAHRTTYAGATINKKRLCCIGS